MCHPLTSGPRAKAVCGFQGNTQPVDSTAQGHSEPQGRRVGSEATPTSHSQTDSSRPRAPLMPWTPGAKEASRGLGEMHACVWKSGKPSRLTPEGQACPSRPGESEQARGGGVHTC